MSSRTTIAYVLALASTVPLAFAVGAYAGLRAGCAAMVAACFLICLSIAHRSRP